MDPMYLPVADISSNEEAAPGTFGSATPVSGLPETKNYAEESEVKNFVQNEIVPLVNEVRVARQTLEEEWRSIRRMEMLKHDSGQRYLGRSNAYIPVWGRILQTRVSTLSRGLFPSDDYMDVADRGEGDPEVCRRVKAYLQWEFENVGHVRQKIKPFLRPYESYGNSPVKILYKKELRTQGKLNFGGGRYGMPSFKPVSCYDGLFVSPRSIFNWYIHPLTAETIDDATCVFEDIDVPRQYIEKMGREKRWVNIEQALNAEPPATHLSNVNAQVKDSADMATPMSSTMYGRKMADVRTITEVWTFMPLPKSAYLPDEVPGTPLPVKVTIASNIAIEVTRNPYWHQKPPYLIGRQNTAPGFFYGYGSGRLVRDLQHLTNDFTNQTNDVGSYSLNPINKVNPAMLAGPLRPLAPGVTWYFTDVNAGQKFERPPLELIGAGQAILQMFVGMAQDFGGAPPVLQGTGAGKAARTATGAQILQRNSLNPIQDAVEDLELDVLVPLMHMTWINAQQFREDDVFVEVAGQPMKLDPAELRLDPHFRWLASSQAANSQQRAAQAMQLMQMVAPLVPMMMQQGYIVDFAYLIKRIYSDGFGMRGFDQFIRKVGPGAGMMPGMDPSMMGVNPQVAQAQQDNLRSAIPQMGDDMVPGEGEDFSGVRDNADDLAALFGAGGGEIQ